jgi:hypothetical protein
MHISRDEVDDDGYAVGDGQWTVDNSRRMHV